MSVETRPPKAPFLLAFVLIAAAALSLATPIASPSLIVLLRPDAPDAQNHIPYVDVAIKIEGPELPAGQPLLRMPLVTNNVETVAATIEKLSVSDAKGPLELTFKDDPEGGASQYRHWVALRATQGQLTVRYRVPMSLVLAPRGAAPPLELRSDTGGFSGQGDTFLLLPELQLPWRFAIHWDLSQMGTHAAGVSTFGKGNVAPDNADLQDLKASFFMGGDVHVYPEAPPATAFHAGLAAVNRKQNCGYIDKTGSLILHVPAPAGKQDCWSSWGEFGDGLSRQLFGAKYGFIDKTGKVIIQPQFDLTLGFSEGLAAVQVGKKWGYIDTTGKMVIGLQDLSFTKPFHNGLARVGFGKNGWGYLDRTGRAMWRSGPNDEGMN